MAQPAAQSDLVRYDEDYHAWVFEQIALLKAKRFTGLDVANLVEELKDLGNSPKREIESRLEELLLHLLKWEFQPGERSNGWRGSIREQRRRIAKAIAESPSLKRYPAEVMVEEYETARLKASGQTGLRLSTFPATCPYAIRDVLADDFWPGPPSELD
jgi:ribosomal protein L29